MIEHCIATQSIRTMENRLFEAIYLLSVLSVSSRTKCWGIKTSHYLVA